MNNPYETDPKILKSRLDAYIELSKAWEALAKTYKEMYLIATGKEKIKEAQK